MTRKGGSLDENAKGYFLETDGMEWFMNHYLTEAERPTRWRRRCCTRTSRACPTASSRPASSTRCATRARHMPKRCGPAAFTSTSKRYDGLIHGAANMTGVLDGGRQLVADTAAHLRAALHR